MKIVSGTCYNEDYAVLEFTPACDYNACTCRSYTVGWCSDLIIRSLNILSATQSEIEEFESVTAS